MQNDRCAFIRAMAREIIVHNTEVFIPDAVKKAIQLYDETAVDQNGHLFKAWKYERQPDSPPEREL
mgnify:CR=1 FL=1